MKPVLLSQRVDVLPERGERRDAVDQRLVAWLQACGYLAMPLPNCPQLVDRYWRLVKPAGVVLSGGNDLAAYGGNAPERDACERRLLQLASDERVPLFALCRGAQLVLDAFGARLERVDGHVASRHDLLLEGEPHQVNSFHQWGCLQVAEPLKVLARSEDGVIEAFRHEQLPITGVMWHPEREAEFRMIDNRLLRHCLG